MKTALFLAILTLLLPAGVAAQNCDCRSQFEFVRNYLETNNPAFQRLKGDPPAFEEYRREVSLLEEAAAREPTDDLCNVHFMKLIGLLRDNHSGVDLNLQRKDIDFRAPEQLQAFKESAEYLAFERIPLDTLEWLETLSRKPLESVEGLYASAGNLRVGIRATGEDAYQAVVLGKTSLPEAGHVLFTLKKAEGSDDFDCTYNLGLLGFNFQKAFMPRVRIADGKIPTLGYSKIPVTDTPGEAPFLFRELNDQTHYLRLKSFDASLLEELHAFFEQIGPALQSKPFLVIDLRDNGGGSERAYFPLMPYLYSQPLEADQVQVWVTPENIRRYEENKAFDTTLLRRMKEAEPFTFIPQIADATRFWSMEGRGALKRVAVLQNRGTASSAEGMITYALQSDKVITLGAHTGGFLGYGDVMELPVPCGKFVLRSSTTRYERNSRYEFVGIPPMIPLEPGQDWVAEAVKALQE